MKLRTSPIARVILNGTLIFSVLCGARAGAATDEPATREMQEKIDLLLNQVQELKRRLDRQTEAQRETDARAEAAAAHAVSEKIEALPLSPQDPSQVPSALNGDPAGPKSIRYKGVSVTLGGFLAAESVWRQHDQANDISTSFAAIPYANSSVGHTQELRFTARQSRISALVQGDVNPETHLGFYSELDFQGGAQTANSNETNSYNPRLRHMTLPHIHIHQEFII